MLWHALQNPAALFLLLGNLDRRDMGLGLVLGTCLGLGLSLGIVLQSQLAFERGQLGAVRQQLANKPALGRDDVSLLDHQHKKQAVGDHEQEGESGQERTFFGLWRWRA